jgi:hypothetical protein
MAATACSPISVTRESANANLPACFTPDYVIRRSMANISGSIPLQLTAPALATATTFAAAAKKRIQKFSRKIADATKQKVERKLFPIEFERRFGHRGRLYGRGTRGAHANNLPNDQPNSGQFKYLLRTASCEQAVWLVP